MFSITSQTEPAVPTDSTEQERWFRGTGSSFPENDSLPFSSVEAEYDLIDQSDLASDDEQDFLVVLNKQGKATKIQRKSESGRRVLLHRGAFSSFESH